MKPRAMQGFPCMTSEGKNELLDAIRRVMSIGDSLIACNGCVGHSMEPSAAPPLETTLAGQSKDTAAFMVDMARLIEASAARRLGANQGEGLDIAKEVAKGLCELWGGVSFYFTKRNPLDMRDAEIYADYRAGASYPELATKYGITEQRVRQLVRVRLGKARGAVHEAEPTGVQAEASV
jgi:Mor family transcriptional regulator